MWWARFRRWTARVEIRLAATVLLLATPVLAAALFLSLAYAAHEMLEERGEELTVAGSVASEALARQPDRPLDDTFYALLQEEDIAVRVVVAGEPAGRLGPEAWFDRRQRNADLLWEAVRADASDVLAFQRAIGPARVEMVASLRDFIKERGELMAGFWVSLIVGLTGSAIFAVIATRWALRPLREATDALRSVHANHLRTRLAVRDTQDVVDLHAQVLNETLDRLEAGFARIRAFSANVAHELRTPINRLLNQAGTRLLAERDPESLTQALLGVQRTAEEMEAIVEGLLLLGQADEGRLRLHMSDVRIDALLAGLGELYRPACEEQGVGLEIAPCVATVHVDETLLVRALCNLIDNALAYTPASGKIRVTASQDGRRVTLRVTDTGKGIPARALEEIFDRFHRADVSGPRRGAGLGLPIARAIAVALGGGVRACADDAGACFELWVPLWGSN